MFSPLLDVGAPRRHRVGGVTKAAQVKPRKTFFTQSSPERQNYKNEVDPPSHSERPRNTHRLNVKLVRPPRRTTNDFGTNAAPVIVARTMICTRHYVSTATVEDVSCYARLLQLLNRSCLLHVSRATVEDESCYSRLPKLESHRRGCKVAIRVCQNSKATVEDVRCRARDDQVKR